MIKLHYTGANTYKEIQNVASKSLGGFVSSTTIQNSIKNSVFPDLSELDLWEEKKINHCIGLAGMFYFFEGEVQPEFMDLQIELKQGEFLTKYSDLFKFKVGLGPLGGDLQNGFYIEQIQSSASKPFYLNYKFVDLNNEIPVLFKEITTKGVGIWFIREFDPKYTRELYNKNSLYWEDFDNLDNMDFDFQIDLKLKEI